MEENRRKFTLPETKTNRQELRKNLTPAESVMWKILKGRQIDGVKFRRQHSVGEYVMDFYCPSLKLCIELDGGGIQTLVNICMIHEGRSS